MPRLFIHAKNADFRSRDDGAEYARPTEALASGVSSAVAMAGEEIAQGRPSVAIEIIVEREDGHQLLRSIVAVSVSPLSTTDPTIIPFPSSS